MAIKQGIPKPGLPYYRNSDSPRGDKNTILKLSETLQVPHLRDLTLIGFALPTL
jgi:hypothetical protein